MEPLMSFEGYQVIENEKKSKDLLDSFYEQLGYTISKSPEEKNIQLEVKDKKVNLNKDIY